MFSGENHDAASSIAVDAEGNAVVAGLTESQGLPTLQGGFNRHTGFLAKFSADGSRLVYSTFVGDDRPFEAKGVALDREAIRWWLGIRPSGRFRTCRSSGCCWTTRR